LSEQQTRSIKIDALRSSFCVLVLYSKERAKADDRYEDQRLVKELYSDLMASGITVIPVLLEPCELPDYLTDVHPADLSQVGWEGKLRGAIGNAE